MCLLRATLPRSPGRTFRKYTKSKLSGKNLIPNPQTVLAIGNSFKVFGLRGSQGSAVINRPMPHNKILGPLPMKVIFPSPRISDA